MQTMREAVHIVGNVARVATQFLERLADARRDLPVGTQPINLDRQDTERLADVIVQLTPDAAAFFLLCVNQPPGEILECLLGLLALNSDTRKVGDLVYKIMLVRRGGMRFVIVDRESPQHPAFRGEDRRGPTRPE